MQKNSGGFTIVSGLIFSERIQVGQPKNCKQTETVGKTKKDEKKKKIRPCLPGKSENLLD